MRYVVIGAGAIGCVVSARLTMADEDVTLLARGAAYQRIRQDGVELNSRSATDRVPVRAVDELSGDGASDDAAVLLCVKSQDTNGALRQVVSAGTRNARIVCFQNGVENERRALRQFADVYGVDTICASTLVAPGVVRTYHEPKLGMFDIGRYPSGADECTEEISAALRRSAFISHATVDIMRWKYRKLLRNLYNAVTAVCGDDAMKGPLPELVRTEGEACFGAAGIAFASKAEDDARRDGVVDLTPTSVLPRHNSTWQSLERQASIETDYLNGEIVMLGRLHGVPTPYNCALQAMAAEMSRLRMQPGAYSVADVMGEAARSGQLPVHSDRGAS